MFKIAIVDDQKTDQDCMTTYLSQYEKEKGVSFDTRVFDNGKNLIYELDEEKYRPDIYFLDIEMDYMNGLETAKKIRSYDENAFLIFVTSHDGYAKDAIDHAPFRYIDKLELPGKLYETLELVQEKLDWENKYNDFYYVQDSTHPERIPYSDILYFEKEDKNAVIVKKPTKNAEGYSRKDRNVSKTRKPLEMIYKELDPNQFAFIDRKIIVNLNHVMGMRKEDIILRDGTILSVRVSRMKELKELLHKKWRGC